MNTILENIPDRALIGWDVDNWKRAFPFWRKHTRLKLNACRGLDIGTWKGGMSLFLARSGAEVVCTDLDGPGREARDLHRQYGVADRITYLRMDGRQITFSDASFDIVIFKSVLGAMRSYEGQHRMCEEILRVLKPGGEVWCCENLVASRLHQMTRNVFVPWGASWRYLALSEIEELFQPFQSMVAQAYGFTSTFGRREWQRRILGKIDRLIDPMIPSHWKYIAFVLARK